MTGIEALVKFIAGEDCGCSERKEKLNKLFPYNRQPQCMNESEYNYWVEFKKSSPNTLSSQEADEVAKIWNRLFQDSRQGDRAGNEDRIGYCYGRDALLMVAACACWALDNNLTQRLTLRDPFALVRIKTLVSGAVGVLIGLVVLGQPLPAPQPLAAALVLGSLSYGVSVVLDAFALRWIGAAREAAYFATAPFVGAIAALALLGDRLQLREAAAMAVMALGVVLLTAERHQHVHTHGEIEHDHLHLHDTHHQHSHAPGDPAGELHSHPHRHAPLVHDHPHFPDAHHRHDH